MMASSRLGLALLLTLPLACSDEGCDDPLIVCDIGSTDCREHVFIQTACARGHTGRDIPPVLSITRDEFEEILRSGPEPTAEQQRADAQTATALRMLGLLPQGTTSNEEAAIASYAANVLAFYTRADKSVTLVETNLGNVIPEDAVFVLSHEFIHAQQDVDIGLQDFFDEHADTADASSATRAITEGEAVHYSNLTMARQEGAAIDDEIFETYYDLQQDALRELATGIGGAGYTDLASVFPYYFGGEIVTDRWRIDGNAGVLDLYDEPPESTAAILRTLAGDPAVPLQSLAIAAEPMPAGWSIVADDTLGAWVLYAYARRIGFADSGADALSRSWVGDRILVAGGASESEAAVIWTIRFSSPADAATFAGNGAIPPEGVQSIQEDGTDVSIVLAVDADTLTLWEGTFQTAQVEDGATSFRQGRLAPRLPKAERPHPPHL